jgi:hypothetical protein
MPQGCQLECSDSAGRFLRRPGFSPVGRERAGGEKIGKAPPSNGSIVIGNIVPLDACPASIGPFPDQGSSVFQAGQGSPINILGLTANCFTQCETPNCPGGPPAALDPLEPLAQPGVLAQHLVRHLGQQPPRHAAAGLGDVAQALRVHSSYNLANTCITFQAAIPRDRLRPVYGQDCRLAEDAVPPRASADDTPARSSHGQPDPEGAHRPQTGEEL